MKRSPSSPHPGGGGGRGRRPALPPLPEHRDRPGHRVPAPAGETFGLFVFAGYQPATELLQGVADLDEQGYVLTDRGQKTSADGLYAAGDVCQKPLRQVVTAVGDGALAATELESTPRPPSRGPACAPRPPGGAPAGAQTSQGQGTEAGGLFPPEMAAQLQTVFSRMTASLVLELTLDSTPCPRSWRPICRPCAGTRTSSPSAPTVPPRTPPASGCAGPTAPGPAWPSTGCRGPRVHLLCPGPLQRRRPGPGPGRGHHGRHPGHPAAHRPPNPGLPVLHHVPRAGHRRPAAGGGQPHITAQAYDLNHFPALRDQYKVMSVPCLVVNHGQQVSFGKKSIAQLLDLLS
ncbi:MAG: FAD-dependent oxidoreductase [Evtepia gabavorous]